MHADASLFNADARQVAVTDADGAPTLSLFVVVIIQQIRLL